MQYLKHFLLLFTCISHLTIYAQKQTVYVFKLNGEIDAAEWRLTKIAFQNAEETQVQVFIIKLNTYGGMVDFGDSIRNIILNAPFKTIAFIENSTGPVGALIATACDRIYMSRSANIGAASAVNTKGEMLSEKYQDYLGFQIRTTAKAKGRNPQIAEAFVDPDLQMPGIKARGQLLTLSTTDAIKDGYCNAEANRLTDILTAENLADSDLINYRESLVDKIIDFMAKSTVRGILIFLMIGGIYLGIQSQKGGPAIIISLVSSLLFFGSLYLLGLAAYWEIGLFLLGVILLLLEVFASPGLGITGVLGVICVIAGLTLSMVLNDGFDFTITASEELTPALFIVMLGLILSVIFSALFGGSLMNSPVFKRRVSKDEAKSGYSSGEQKAVLVHKTGVAKTDLKPSGKIVIDGKWYDAVSLDGFIQQGSSVLVDKQENFNVFVRKINS